MIEVYGMICYDEEFRDSNEITCVLIERHGDEFAIFKEVIRRPFRPPEVGQVFDDLDDFRAFVYRRMSVAREVLWTFCANFKARVAAAEKKGGEVIEIQLSEEEVPVVAAFAELFVSENSFCDDWGEVTTYTRRGSIEDGVFRLDMDAYGYRVPSTASLYNASYCMTRG